MAKRKKSDEAVYLQPDATTVGFSGCCPRCGQGRLYAGLLTPAKGCLSCGLDYSFIDSGDGPAVFVILIIGFVVTGLAVLVESQLSPPLWVHFLLWIPVITGLSIWGLRFSKGIMISLQYQTAASEGTLVEHGPSKNN